MSIRSLEDEKEEIAYTLEMMTELMWEVRNMIILAPGYQGIIATKKGPYIMRQEILDKLEAIFPLCDHKH